MSKLQVILGSGGAIGTQLAKALPKYTDKIRLVSRNPNKVNPGDELMKADLTNAEEVYKAVEGASVVYLTVGLTYSTKVWAELWPRIIQVVIDACEANQAKLVFFDNIYMYDKNYLNGMNEDTPVNPSSKKGAIRKAIAEKLMYHVAQGTLTALIARSADFYGPGIKNTSMLTETVFNNLEKGKKAQWMCSLDFKHSFTYTPDAGKATAMLGNTPDAYGKVWHLPTAPNPFNGKEWIDAIAKEMNVQPKYQVASRFLVRILGLFMPIMKEFVEMLYQYDREYVFDSSRFEKKFDFKPTPYSEGIKEIVRSDY